MHPQCVTWHMLYIYIAANGLSDTMVGGYFVVSPCLSYLVMGFPVSPPKLGARDPEAIWLDTISVALRWIKIYKNHLSYKNIVVNRVQQPKNDRFGATKTPLFGPKQQHQPATSATSRPAFDPELLPMGLGVVPLETLEATAMLIVVKAPELVLDSEKISFIYLFLKSEVFWDSESFFFGNLEWVKTIDINIVRF